MRKIVLLSAVILTVVLVSGCNLKDTLANRNKGYKVVSQKEAAVVLEKFIKESLLAPGAEAVIKETTEENGLYKVKVALKINGQEQEVTSYLSKDAKLFFPSAETAMNIEEVTKKAAESKNAGGDTATQAAKDPVKTDKPVVDLFVMAHCPFGTQMEKGIIPAIEALGSKVTFNLKFVSYTMHGDKEATENMRQYCIQKNSPAKLLGYLKCFLKSTAGDAVDAEKCMTTVGISKGTIDSCITTNNEKFAVKAGETGFNVDKADNEKYGVQGSPTLVINGVTSTSGRDSASILKAICGSFKTAPAECKKELSATAPAAGFGEGTAAAGAPAASCETPTN